MCREAASFAASAKAREVARPLRVLGCIVKGVGPSKAPFALSFARPIRTTMIGSGPSNRGNEPLRILPMAAALVIAAVAGALIGFALDLFHGDEVSVNGEPPAT